MRGPGCAGCGMEVPEEESFQALRAARRPRRRGDAAGAAATAGVAGAGSPSGRSCGEEGAELAAGAPSEQPGKLAVRPAGAGGGGRRCPAGGQRTCVASGAARGAPSPAGGPAGRPPLGAVLPPGAAAAPGLSPGRDRRVFWETLKCHRIPDGIQRPTKPSWKVQRARSVPGAAG
ncbi:hypothetical protein Nmel_007250 [Mimus melanotis]